MATKLPLQTKRKTSLKRIEPVKKTPMTTKQAAQALYSDPKSEPRNSGSSIKKRDLTKRK